MTATSSRTKIRMLLTMAASAALLVVCSGSSCPGEGSSAKFTGRNTSAAVTVTKEWRDAVLIDVQAIDTTSAFHNNITSNASDLGLTSYYPMAVFNDIAESFYVVFNRGIDDTAPNAAAVNTYVTRTSVFSSDTWSTGLAGFTQLDVNVGTDPQRSLAAVDGNGNATVVFTTPKALYARRPIGLRHVFGNGAAWNTPVDLSSTSITTAGAGATNPTMVDSVALATDNFNQTTVVWCQGGEPFFNQYRSFSGWRFSSSESTDNSWDTGVNPCYTATATGLGITVGFDGSGNGFGAYTTSGQVIVWRRWSPTDPSSWTGVVTPLTGAANDAYPKLAVLSDGLAYIFFYRNLNLGAGTATLHYALAPAATAIFGAPDTFEALVGSPGGGTDASVTDGTLTDAMPPIVSSKGSKIAVAYIKVVNAVRRLYVSRYSDGVWTSPTAVDGSLGDVTWADVSVNATGEVAVAFAVTVGATERVYGNIYSNGNWGGPSRLDTLSTVSATGATRPSVSIDSAGNAVATFSMSDGSSIRRAVAATYR